MLCRRNVRSHMVNQRAGSALKNSVSLIFQPPAVIIWPVGEKVIPIDILHSAEETVDVEDTADGDVT